MVTFGTRQLLLMLGNAVVAWLVLRDANADLWGGFVKIYLLISLIGHFLNFGHRDFLLRSFGHQPAEAIEQFQQCLLSRGLLLPLAFVLVLPFLDVSLWIWSFLWITSQFIYQSLDVFIFYHKRFGASALVEGLAFALTILILLMGKLDLTWMVMTFAISFLIRMVLLVIILPSAIWLDLWRWSKVNLRYFGEAKWFFLIGLSGLLQSRIDLYTISFFLSDEEIGKYQIMVSFLLLIQVSSSFLLTPFSINLMRQSFETMRRTAWRSTKFGVLFCVLGVAAVFVILRAFYHISVEPVFYLCAFLLVCPIFYYLTWIYYLYGENLEKEVMRWNFMGALVNAVLTFALITKLGILGALMSSAVVQLGLLILLPSLARSHFRRSNHT